MKKFLLIFSVFVLLFATSKSAHAAGEFTTSFTSTYTIHPLQNETSVNHRILLTNNLAHIYATEYTLATSGEHLERPTASDESGNIVLTTAEQGGMTTLHTSIDRPAIGLGKTKTLNFSYQTNDTIEMLGNTTTINIPRLAHANEAQSYIRIVKIQGFKDQQVLISPLPSTTTEEGEYMVYTFIGHASESLTLLFGNNLTYKLNLTYELKNRELNGTDSELALPPDTGYQHIILDNIDPPPLDIHLDSDGNWLARYHLKSQETVRITAQLYATIYPTPTVYDPSNIAFIKSAHTKYWDNTAGNVLDLAAQLKTPENIYNYLTSNFTYNYAGIVKNAKRLGASNALASKTLVLCTEFTDSFVALARTNGIPAREINGYGYTTNTSLHPQSMNADILHAWPEYYDANKHAWISVDPTWGNTTGGIDYFNKLDFSHIVFVRHGIEDSYPLPAGAYKDTPDQKFVSIEIAQEIVKENPKYEIKNKEVHNTGNIALINQVVSNNNQEITIPYLPPYGIFVLPVQENSSLYDKIKRICVNLLSKLLQPR